MTLPEIITAVETRLKVGGQVIYQAMQERFNIGVDATNKNLHRHLHVRRVSTFCVPIS